MANESSSEPVKRRTIPEADDMKVSNPMMKTTTPTVDDLGEESEESTKQI